MRYRSFEVKDPRADPPGDVAIHVDVAECTDCGSLVVNRVRHDLHHHSLSRLEQLAQRALTAARRRF